MAEQPSSTNAAPVVFKKYGNRRLYDTSASRYVTLDEVASMLQRGIDIRVVDAKRGDDLTKEILVQIILEREGAREVLPTSLLKQVVRVAGSPMRENLTRALQDTIDGFAQTVLQSQRALADAQRAMLAQVPGMAAQLWNPFAAFAPPPAPQLGQAPAPLQQQQQQRQDGEIGRLRAEVEQTQALLRQLIDSRPAAAARPARASKRRRAAR